MNFIQLEMARDYGENDDVDWESMGIDKPIGDFKSENVKWEPINLNLDHIVWTEFAYCIEDYWVLNIQTTSKKHISVKVTQELIDYFNGDIPTVYDGKMIDELFGEITGVAK